MKIALFSAFYPYRGGIAQFSAMLYRALETEHDVSAFTFKRQYPDFLFPGSSQYVTEDDNPDVIDAERVLDTVNPASFISAAKKIKSLHPDVMISQYWMTFFGPSIGGMQKRLKNMKRVCILHNVIPHEKRFFDKGANNYFLKQNDAFVVMSDVVMKDLLSLKPDAKYLRIDHPVYSHFGDKIDRQKALDKLGLNASKKYLLFFGFIREYKGLDLLIKAMDHLPEDVELIVAGEVYGSFEKYQACIDESNSEGRIHLFNQYISDDEVTTYFSASDVCVLPYKSATQSGITAISHHFDLPVIATDVGGLKENTKHGVTGLIVDEPKEELLSSAIQHYFDAELKQEMSSNIAIEQKENSWENFAAKLVDFINTI